ncbi:MAG: hypothetical protein JKX75_02290 [Gammaproteobacteria bacterium]|nr:hypothetical protein [Gammaproteobacteria bacterium]
MSKKAISVDVAEEHLNDVVSKKEQGEGRQGIDAMVAVPVTGDEKIDSVVIDQKSQAKSCFSLGPFRDLAMLRNLTSEIKPYVKTTDFRGQEIKEQSLYWVYIKPENNRAKAVATSKRLKAKKVKDFYLIREGEKINGISLGYFRSQSGANGLVSKVKKLGFNVVIEPKYKKLTVYWLDYQLDNILNLPEAIVAKYIKLEKKEKIVRLKLDCHT